MRLLPRLLIVAATTTASLTLSPLVIASADVTPPAPVQYFTAMGGNGTATLSWLNPSNADTHFIARMVPGTTPPETPTSGTAVYDGTGTSAKVSHLIAGQSYSFSVWTEDSLGNFSTPAHQVLIGTRVLLSVPKVVPVGLLVQVSARLLRVTSGTGASPYRIRFYARQPGSSTQSFLGVATTYVQGIARLNIRVSGHPYILAKFLGANSLGASVSVARHPTTAIGMQGYFTGNIVTGDTEKVWGTVYPNLAGHRIYLQRHSGGVWVPFQSTLVTSSSTFSIRFRPAAGIYSFRVVMPATNGYAALVTTPFVFAVY